MRWQRTESGRVRADVSSTIYKISSNRPNDRARMRGLGRLATDGVVLPNSPADKE